ncbi:MAG: hypothetical protein IKM02_04355 [Clostridia bacterium]|nr:hypothetical protein [Clostridia bacterium]
MDVTREGRNRNKISCPNCGTYWYVDDDDEYINDGSAWSSDDDEDDDDDASEGLSVYEAALIWASKGKDEDYMFGYSEDELEDAL